MDKKIQELVKMAKKDKKFRKELVKLSFKNLSEDELNAAIIKLAEERGIHLDEKDMKQEYANPMYGKELSKDLDDLDQIENVIS